MRAFNATGNSAYASAASATTLVAIPMTVALKTLSSITVDGTLDESVWNLTQTVENAVSGVGNNTVTFGALWTPTYLYLAAEVLDADLENDSTSVWHDDGVEFYLDPDRSRSSSYDSDDRQVTKGYDDSALGGIGSHTGIVHATTAIIGGYTVEIAIPWTNLNLTPTGGTSVLGFDVGINDDGDGGNRDNQLMWTGTFYNSSTTEDFGDLFISDETVGTTPPTAPSSLTGTTVSATRIDLAWADNSSDETGFAIQRTLTSGGTYAEIATGGTDVTSYSDTTGLSASTSYTYRVLAYSASGSSAASNEATVATDDGGGDSWSDTPLPTISGYSGDPALFERHRTGWLTQTNIDAKWDILYTNSGYTAYPWRRISMDSPDASEAFKHSVEVGDYVLDIVHSETWSRVNYFRGVLLRYRFYATDWSSMDGKLFMLEGGRGWIGDG
ncbi:MAG: hypothetical protein J6386_03080 [Candidatus Synoicihabitans palmerolidicus]|nr:hypothetical protein [Candidatus Synoicihabitans palmerolidicus]